MREKKRGQQFTHIILGGIKFDANVYGMFMGKFEEIAPSGSLFG